MAHAAHDLIGVYDAFGNQLTVTHANEHAKHILGEQLANLAAYHQQLRAMAATVADQPDHPIHAAAAKAEADLADASHGRLSGLWRIDRYDAPIEWYAAKVTGHTYKEGQYPDFHHLPAAIQAQADAALKRDKRPTYTEFADTFENLFLTVGVTAMWQQAIGTTISANSGASAAGTYAYYNNAQARICVGDSTTAAAASQTWLQAATNKYCVGMDASYPTQSTNQAVFRATFGSAVANYAWQEFVIDNCNGSNATSTTQSGGSALDRVVSNQGTKASGQTLVA